MNKIISEYLKCSNDILRKIADSEADNLDAAARIVAEGYINGKTIYIFGCTHSAILAEDVFYRAGAPAFWRPLWGPGMSIAGTPGLLTSAAEHNEELGRSVIECSSMKAGDVLLIASTSGKNAAPVAVAEAALERGAKLIVLTSGNYRHEAGNHSKYPNLRAFEGNAVFIDNHVPEGDASIKVGDFGMGPLSTLAGSFIMHSLSALAAEKIAETGIMPPVFMSSNVPGGREINERMLAQNPKLAAAFRLP